MIESMKSLLIALVMAIFLSPLAPAAEFESTPGVSIHYEESGKKDTTPIVFIHGFPFNHHMWDAQVKALSAQHRVISYDQRGFGASTASQPQYTLEALVDDFNSLLDHLQIKKAIVVGFSMGGYVALRAIERNPERFAGLVLHDTNSLPDSDASKLKRWRHIQQIRSAGLITYGTEFLKAALYSGKTACQNECLGDLNAMMTIQNTSSGIQSGLMAMATRTDTSATLPKIKVPTLILTGDHDQVVLPEVAKTLHEKISASTLVVLPNAGHMSSFENPEAFQKALADFLKANSFQLTITDAR